MRGKQARRCVVIGLLAVMAWSVTADVQAQTNGSSEPAIVVYTPSIFAEPLKESSVRASIARASAQSGVLHRPQKSCGKKVLLGLGIGAAVGTTLGLASGIGKTEAGVAGIASITMLGGLIGLVAGLNTCR